MRSMEASSPGPAGARSVSVPVTKRASRPRRKASVASQADGRQASPFDRAALIVAARSVGAARFIGAKARPPAASSRRWRLLRLLRVVIVKNAVLQTSALRAPRVLEGYGFAQNRLVDVCVAARTPGVMSGCSGALFEGQSVAWHVTNYLATG